MNHPAKPPYYKFENTSHFGWLAECERALRGAKVPLGAGTVSALLRDSVHQLWYRSELGAAPYLYRAIPA